MVGAKWPSIMTNSETVLVTCNIILAFGTVALAVMTLRLEFAWKKCSSEQISAWSESTAHQIGVQTWLVLQTRFDSTEMKRARQILARQLSIYSENNHLRIEEDVLNFFESVGTAHRLKVLDQNLAESSFSYYLCQWWRAAKPYVVNERMHNKNDETLFDDFEKLAEEWREFNPKLKSASLQEFLLMEMSLTVESGPKSSHGGSLHSNAP
jgi:hypothetical protein